MEPIVLALISRKVINYSLCQIIKNYKEKLKIILTYNNKNEPNYELSFIAPPVSEVSSIDSNILLNDLFQKKSLYNIDSHLEGKPIPPFITNIWDYEEKNFNFEKKEELEWFHKIITKDIKSGFNFDSRDVSVNDYLKSVNLEEF